MARLAGAKAPEKQEYGNKEVNAVLAAVQAETGLPPSGSQKHARYWASHLLKRLQNAYPQHCPVLLARKVMQAALALRDTWHTPKAANLKHLANNWQEIVGKNAQGPPHENRMTAYLAMAHNIPA